MSIQVYGTLTQANEHCKYLQHIPQLKNRSGAIVNGATLYLFHRRDKDSFYLPLYYALKCGYQPPETPDYLMDFTGTLRPNQEEPMRECMDDLLDARTGFLDLPTGFGKTVMGAYAACHLQLLTVVLVKQLKLIEQWQNTFHNHTTASVFVFDPKKHYNGEQVIIMMCRRVANLPEEIRRDVGFLIVDEADTFLTKEGIAAMLGITCGYLMLQTATATRTDKLHSMFDQLVGPKRIRVERTKPFTYCAFYTGITVTRNIDANGHFNWCDIVSQLSENGDRDRIIVDYALSHHKDVTLILCREIQHAKRLCEIANTAIDSDYIAGTKSQFKTCSFYAGTLSKIGRGFDLCSHTHSNVPIDHVIIADSIANPSSLAQAAGRARKEGSRVTMVIDSDKAIERHNLQAIDWVKLNGCINIEHVKAPKYSRSTDKTSTIDGIPPIDELMVSDMSLDEPLTDYSDDQQIEKNNDLTANKGTVTDLAVDDTISTDLAVDDTTITALTVDTVRPNLSSNTISSTTSRGTGTTSLRTSTVSPSNNLTSNTVIVNKMTSNTVTINPSTVRESGRRSQHQTPPVKNVVTQPAPPRIKRVQGRGGRTVVVK